MTGPSMWESLSKPHLDQTYKFYTHLDRYALEDLPITDDGLRNWLEDRWSEKGARLESLRQDLAAGIWNGKPL